MGSNDLGCPTHEIEFVVISHADQMAVVFEQLLLNGVHQAGIRRDVGRKHVLPQGERGGGANALTDDGAGGHDSRGGEGDVRGGDIAPGEH